MSLFTSFKEEIKLYFFDKWLLASVTLVPLFLAFFLVHIFGNGQIQNIPIGIVDLDNSKLSRQLIRSCNASANLQVKTDFISQKEALLAMQKREIYAFLIIPKNLQKNFTKGYQINIPSYFNSQFILIGRSIDSALKIALENFNAKIKTLRHLSRGNIKLQQAFSTSVPIQMQITPLYNLSLNYAKFLLTAILPAIWQIIIVVSLVLNFAAQNNKTTMKSWIIRFGFKGFFAKLLIHQVLMMVLCVGFLLYFSLYLNFYVASWSLLLFAAWLCILASQAMGSLFYFINLDAPRALSLTAGFTAPSLAFMGVTFPISDMSTFAKIWSSLLPVIHYMKLQIALTAYESLSFEYKEHFFKLSLFCIAFLIVFLLAKKATKKELS